MRFLGNTADDYAAMTDADLVRLMGYPGWSYDADLMAEVRARGLF